MAITRTAAPRHWPRAQDLVWQRRLAVARLESWEAELAGGRRPLTPQLAEAIRADRALVERQLATDDEATGGHEHLAI